MCKEYNSRLRSRDKQNVFSFPYIEEISSVRPRKSRRGIFPTTNRRACGTSAPVKQQLTHVQYLLLVLIIVHCSNVHVLYVVWWIALSRADRYSTYRRRHRCHRRHRRHHRRRRCCHRFVIVIVVVVVVRSRILLSFAERFGGGLMR